jgi:hypothetical protein
MIRNLKVLGLALVALLALGATAASLASAAGKQGELTTENGVDVTLFGTETTTAGDKFDNSLTAFGSKVICPGSTYTGHKYNITPHERVPQGATTVTLTPHYNQAACRAFEPEREATVEMNGCDYVFHVGETTTSANTYGVTADVVCPAEKKIHVGVWTLGEKHETGNRLCTIEVGPQNGLKGTAHITTTTTPVPDDIDVHGTFENIVVTRHGLCLLDGKGTTDLKGIFHLDVTVIGKDKAGNQVGITVTDKEL